MTWNKQNREKVITGIAAAFVSPSKANKAIYENIIRTLWPEGSDLPGPIVSRAKLREQVNVLRRKSGATNDYLDVYRRLRELQGEEGLLGIVKVGSSYQMLHAEVSEKRIPRAAFRAGLLEVIAAKADFSCQVCGEQSNTSGHQLLVLDHRVPRSRLNERPFSGVESDSENNLQVLCQNCNTHKSVACRGCQADCFGCPWAFPESNPSVTIRGDVLKSLVDEAKHSSTTAQALLERILHDRYDK